MSIILEDLLKNLAKDLKIPFKKEITDSYSYQINEKLIIQIEMSQKTDELIIGSFFANLPPGKFRENVLAQGLMANYILEDPSFFAFSPKKSDVFLYQSLNLEKLTSPLLQENLTSFIEKTLKWQEALEKGYVAPAEFTQTIISHKRSNG